MADLPRFVVVRCFSCALFQVLQRRKDQRFKCRVCGELQSRRKLYGSADQGKLLRPLVQQLNAAAAKGRLHDLRADGAVEIERTDDEPKGVTSSSESGALNKFEFGAYEFLGAEMEGHDQTVMFGGSRDCVPADARDFYLNRNDGVRWDVFIDDEELPKDGDEKGDDELPAGWESLENNRSVGRRLQDSQISLQLNAVDKRIKRKHNDGNSRLKSMDGTKKNRKESVDNRKHADQLILENAKDESFTTDGVAFTLVESPEIRSNQELGIFAQLTSTDIAAADDNVSMLQHTNLQSQRSVSTPKSTWSRFCEEI